MRPSLHAPLLCLALLAAATPAGATPAGEMDSFAPMAGNWTCTGFMQRGPVATKETITGSAEVAYDAAGGKLSSTYRVREKGKDKDTVATGVITWDAAKKVYNQELAVPDENLVSSSTSKGWVKDVAEFVGTAKEPGKVAIPAKWTFKKIGDTFVAQGDVSLVAGWFTLLQATCKH